MSARREGKGKGQGTAAKEAVTAMNNDQNYPHV
jgi:hypothetical protein